MTILNKIQTLIEQNTDRNSIKPGMLVAIVEKQNQKTIPQILTRGKVKRVLSPGDKHSRGIKVMLITGTVGRVQNIIGFKQNKFTNSNFNNVDKSDNEDPNADWHDDLKF